MVGMYPLKEAYQVSKKEEKEKVNEEGFISDSDSKQNVSSIFASIGLMVFAILIAILFFWAYRKERSLFIVALSVVILIYTIMMTILIVLQRKNIENVYFTMGIGATSFIGVMSILLIITFSIVASRRLNKSYLGTETQDYLSRTAEV